MQHIPSLHIAFLSANATYAPPLFVQLTENSAE